MKEFRIVRNNNSDKFRIQVRSNGDLWNWNYLNTGAGHPLFDEHPNREAAQDRVDYLRREQHREQWREERAQSWIPVEG